MNLKTVFRLLLNGQNDFVKLSVINYYELCNHLLINTKNGSLGSFGMPYMVFNCIEALCWFYISISIIFRYLRHKKTKMEILYAISFFAFALSDVIETSGITLLLLLFKGVCILAIVGFRNNIRLMYNSKVY